VTDETYRKGILAVLWRNAGRQQTAAAEFGVDIRMFLKECRQYGITTADIKKIRNYCSSRFTLTDSKSALRITALPG
jgi:hypothetical protein